MPESRLMNELLAKVSIVVGELTSKEKADLKGLFEYYWDGKKRKYRAIEERDRELEKALLNSLIAHLEKKPRKGKVQDRIDRVTGFLNVYEKIRPKNSDI